jgi:hypothetical protein
MISSISIVVLLSYLHFSIGWIVSTKAAARRRHVSMIIEASIDTNQKASSSSATTDPLLVRAYRGEAVDRSPVWLMRQVGYIPFIMAMAALSCGYRFIGRSIYG